MKESPMGALLIPVNAPLDGVLPMILPVSVRADTPNAVKPNRDW
jgi:hypothetical protein